MILYHNKSGKLTVVPELNFKLEKDIQGIFEDNLQQIMNLELVKSEFTIKNKRIDTLAFDSQSKAFIIIEYKRDKNVSVIDQGFTYLSLMLENKADFIVEHNESLKRNLKREDVDWSQTRVVFVSTYFTENQIVATNFKDIAIELWEVKRFDNDILTIRQIKKTSSAESIKVISKNSEILRNVAEEIKVYTESDHFEKGSDTTVDLYKKILKGIENMTDNLEIDFLKYWINLDVGKRTVASIEMQKKKINLFINLKKGALDDPKEIARDVSKIGHYGKGDYQIVVDSDASLEYIMSLVKQAI